MKTFNIFIFVKHLIANLFNNRNKFLLIAILIIPLYSCEDGTVNECGCTDPRATNYNNEADYDDGNCRYANSSVVYDNPDNLGNLVINNNTEYELRLYYNNNELVKTIRRNQQNYVVNIPNKDLSSLNLKIWKVDDVIDVLNPPDEKIFRRWKVALSNNTSEEERGTWNINGDEEIMSGVGLLSYLKKDIYGLDVEYSVDIYVDNKTGAKIASFSPGVTDKKVNIEYGVRTLFFNYWVSDQITGEVYDVGWQEFPAFVVNDAHITHEVEIPIMYAEIEVFGNITIHNNLTTLIAIYANGNLIETIAKVDGSPEGLSYINPDDSTNFLIPSGNYKIIVKQPSNEQMIDSFANVYISPLGITQRYVEDSYKIINVTNNTSEKLFLYNKGTGNYLGMMIEPDSTVNDFEILGNILNLRFTNKHATNEIYADKNYSNDIIIKETDLNN